MNCEQIARFVHFLDDNANTKSGRRTESNGRHILQSHALKLHLNALVLRHEGQFAAAAALSRAGS